MKQVAVINDSGNHFKVFRKDGDVNPYRLYRVWYDRGWHQKLIAKYADLGSCLYTILGEMRKGE